MRWVGRATVRYWPRLRPLRGLGFLRGRAAVMILDIVTALDSHWVLYPGQMEYSAAAALELGNVGNGPDGIVGNLDDARMERVVALLKDVLDGAPQDLEASDIYTNEFIDPSIGF